MPTQRTTVKAALPGLALFVCLLVASIGANSASAAINGNNFGFADVNTGLPGDPNAPAFPSQKAVWAGTCDLSSPGTANGGTGSASTFRPHCIDTGDETGGTPPFVGFDSPWPVGAEPSWRLDPVTTAGAHPDGTVEFFFNYENELNGVSADGNVKNIIVKLPPGVVGNPEAVPQCAAIEAQAVPAQCGAESQIGINTIDFATDYPLAPRNLFTQAVYAVEARDTVTAEFLIDEVGGVVNVPIMARGRTNGDYGVDTLALLIPNFVPIGGQAFTFWGVPWAEAHDIWRTDGDHGLLGGLSLLSTGLPPSAQHPYEPEWGPIEPFFTNPTQCSGEPLPLTIEADSWQDPVAFGGGFKTATVPADRITACDKLEFDPSIQLHPTASVADSPSGLDVTLSVPQNNDPPAGVAFDPADDTGAPAYWKTDAGLATAHLKDTTIHLPAGTSFNPAAANGLRGCTTAQIGLTATFPKTTFNNDEVQCPDTSKIGTLQINSPLLPDPLFGAVYAAPQNDNPFPGSLTAIYLVSQDEERGLSIKLAGKVDLDPDTGQIATTFVDNPQLPFNDFILHLKTGPRAPLNTPATCGQFENSADLTPWSFPDSGPQPTIHDPFPIAAMPNGLGCVTEPEDRGFAPGFEAGSTSTRAAAYTGFVLNVTRKDGEQEISGISLDMPPGVVGDLSQIAYCPEASIAAARSKTGLEETNAPSCPAASYVGRVDTLAGAGPLPLPAAGRLYLSGPYDPDGAGPKPLSPISVTTIVPAIAGGVPGDPAFDLGNVVIRTGVNLSPQTAQVHIDSTDVPYIVGGVPLRIRSVAVDLDRPNFILNPTNCEGLAVGGGIGGAADPLDPTDDVLAAVSSRFQVDGCRDLGFKPKLSLRLRGGTKRGQFPQLTATYAPRAGDANLKSISVTLPRTEFLAQSHIDTVCTRVQFAQDACPAGSVYGHARAYTPLLREPLEGPVILRSNGGDRLLPDMVLDLHGQLDLELEGHVDSVKGGLRNSFDIAPDAPVTKFVLSLKGGRKSLLENSTDICATTKTVKRNGKSVRSKPAATVAYVAHNGVSVRQRVTLKAKGCQRKRQKHSGGQHRRG